MKDWTKRFAILAVIGAIFSSAVLMGCTSGEGGGTPGSTTPGDEAPAGQGPGTTGNTAGKSGGDPSP